MTKFTLCNRNLKRFPIFEGDELTLEEVKRRMPPSENIHPSLCIHGASIAPEKIIAQCHDANQRYTKSASEEGQNLKLKFIPVIWPAEDSLKRYFVDRHKNSVGGKAFKALEEIAAEFPTKSLMAHSMGNRVLRYFASPAFKFDNIFLVAADVNHRLFNKKYIDKKDYDHCRCKDGLRIHSMLQNDNSKICVLYHKKDCALIFSNAIKFFTAPRLGKRGVKESDLHPKFKGKDIIKNVDFSDRVSTKFSNHNYQFSDEAIDFYHEVIHDFT